MDEPTLNEALDHMDAKMALSYTACLLMAIVLSGDRADIIEASKAIASMDSHTDLIDKYKDQAHEMMNMQINSEEVNGHPRRS